MGIGDFDSDRMNASEAIFLHSREFRNRSINQAVRDAGLSYPQALHLRREASWGAAQWNSKKGKKRRVAKERRANGRFNVGGQAKVRKKKSSGAKKSDGWKKSNGWKKK